MNEQLVIIDIQWFGVTSVKSLSWHDQRLLKYFNVTSHRGSMTEFDVPTQHQIVPYSLSPTDGLHRLLSKAAKGDSECRRLPYVIENYFDGHSLQIVSVTGELFPGDVLVVKVRARIKFPEYGGWFDKLYPQLRLLRTPRSSKRIDSLIRKFIAVSIGGAKFPVKNVSFRDYFVLQVADPLMSESPLSESSTRNFAALLTDAVMPKSLGKAVIEYVTDENRTLNEKAESESLLINRQGATYYLPGAPYESPNRHRFKKVSELAMIGLFARQFLGDLVEYRSRHPGMAEFIVDRLRRFVEVPDLVFASSFANHHTWEVLANSLKLEFLLADWDARTSERKTSLADGTPAIPSQWWANKDFEAEMDNR